MFLPYIQTLFLERGIQITLLIVLHNRTLDVSAPVFFTRMYSNVASMTLNLSSYQYVFIAITYTNSTTYGVVINVKTGELSATECILLCKITKSTFYRYLNELKEDRQKGII